ncbi:MAG: bifunctional riboflavin kinase/FAD synthetase [Deltaproteobacteria bacterium]|nr:bifunctional riboflavin kinase/FAD synthetase [Deltaproteobacteria bacterium]
MEIIRGLDELRHPLENPVLTIGNFDGVHKGHLELFRKTRERAQALKGQSIVMTFEPHPVRVMKPGNGPPLITPTQQKLELIGEAGIDVILCTPFTREFASISAPDFVEKILVGKMGIKEIVVGYDYTFGYDRKGDIALLRELGDKLGFTVHVVAPVYVDNKLVSSTSIRKLVQEGRIAEAEVFLGRHYQVSGTVIKGAGRGGRLLGFPTANLRLIDELIPKKGVYAVTVLLEEGTYDGVTNIGYNPTFGGDNPLSVETHLLGFSGDLLGKTIRINFIHRLRDEMPFESVEDLAQQIARDVEDAREVLKDRQAPAISGSVEGARIG